ncbi:MAG TPA: cytochrome c biogenesis protein CcsA [Rhodocyclaceae bacterium]|jgi:ABC-type uncharacterized transport system permease subunit|nr:cytochrome c biogenesis protein CcsA [Rhodocyclaceae bacterium]
MLEILPYLLAAALYLSLALYFWRGPADDTALNAGSSKHNTLTRGWLLVALICHGLTVANEMFGDEHLRFGFAVAISLMLWLALAFYWIESYYMRMDGLLLLGLPFAAVGAVLPLVFPGQHLLGYANELLFRAHFLVAMLAYSLFALAALHALLMMTAERSLHRGRLPRIVAGLPPLLTMEALLFRLIHIAFVLLTLTLASGIFFSEELFGKPMGFTHKTVFAILSWLIFAALLLGRHLRGWRGRLALHWTLTGFGALFLAYIGSRFVLEVLLHRAG